MGHTFIIAALILIVFGGLFFLFSKKERSVCYQRRCFRAEVADNESARQRGLMHRQKLDDDKGMLFIFDHSDKYSFWMKDTLIPLDIIWIDKDKEIVDIKESAMPCGKSNCESYVPKAPAKYVLEINAGMAKDTGMKIGDKL